MSPDPGSVDHLLVYDRVSSEFVRLCIGTSTFTGICKYLLFFFRFVGFMASSLLDVAKENTQYNIFFCKCYNKDLLNSEINIFCLA